MFNVLVYRRWYSEIVVSLIQILTVVICAILVLWLYIINYKSFQELYFIESFFVNFCTLLGFLVFLQIKTLLASYSRWLFRLKLDANETGIRFLGKFGSEILFEWNDINEIQFRKTMSGLRLKIILENNQSEIEVEFIDYGFSFLNKNLAFAYHFAKFYILIIGNDQLYKRVSKEQLDYLVDYLKIPRVLPYR